MTKSVNRRALIASVLAMPVLVACDNKRKRKRRKHGSGKVHT